MRFTFTLPIRCQVQMGTKLYWILGSEKMVIYNILEREEGNSFPNCLFKY